MRGGGREGARGGRRRGRQRRADANHRRPVRGDAEADEGYHRDVQDDEQAAAHAAQPLRAGRGCAAAAVFGAERQTEKFNRRVGEASRGGGGRVRVREVHRDGVGARGWREEDGGESEPAEG